MADSTQIEWTDSTWNPVTGCTKLTAGCDKSFATCRARFANGLNFRGFPHMPGSDFSYSYADGDGQHDGGVLFP